MGRKGAKLTEETTAAGERLVGMVSALGEVSGRKMFGGYGVFESGVMFGLVSSEGRVYLKGGEGNLERYEAEGCERFGRMPYWEVPEDVLADGGRLLEWAGEALVVARASLS